MILMKSSTTGTWHTEARRNSEKTVNGEHKLVCVAVQVPTLLWYMIAGNAHTGVIPNPPLTEFAAPG